MTITPAVRILAIGGSTRPQSSSELALNVAAMAAQAAGAEVISITGRDLMFPIYDTETTHRDPLALDFVEKVRTAHGILIASPGYHGGISGMMKNALDYIEDLREHDPSYLDGRSVGCISVAYGWQATVSTLHQLRQVVHALRGWPTPLGGTVNASVTKFDPDGSCQDTGAAEQLAIIGRQVVEFAQMRQASADTTAPSAKSGS
jgi:FMN reductase